MTLRFSREWAVEVQERIEGVMDTLEASVEGESEHEVRTPSGQLYCSCMECYRREVVYMAVESAIEGFTEGLVELVTLEAEPYVAEEEEGCDTHV